MSKKLKVTPEEKAAIIRRYLKGELSIREAGRAVGAGMTTMRGWIAQYETEGIEAFMPHQQNRMYSPELKLAAVYDYMSGKGSYYEIAKKYKLRSDRQLREWVKVYNAHGNFNFVKHSGGGSYMKQVRNTTQEERIEIVQECIASGKNYGEMALKYNVSYQQVRNWTLRYEELGEAGLEDRRGKRKKDQEPRTELEKAQVEIEQLKHKLHLAEMERDLLKKLDEVVRRDAYHK